MGASAPLLIRRYLYLCVGWFALALGLIGIFLPLIPTTPFLLLTAFCFSRGSERLHRWLLRQPWIGKVISDWERDRVIPLRVKIIASALLLCSVIYPTFFMSIPWGAKLVMGATLGAVVLVIWCYPSQRSPERGRSD